MSRRAVILTLLGILALIPQAGRTPIAHRLLVPFIVVFLVWNKREQLQAIGFERSAWGPALVIVGACINILGLWFYGEILEPMGAAVIAIGAGFWAVGRQAMKELAFPAAFLVFLVPWQSVLAPYIGRYLQNFAVVSSCALGNLSGLHPVRQGLDIALPGITLEVASACSGMQALMALTAVSALFAYFTRAPLWQRWVMFGVGIPLALVLNVARVWIIMMAGTILGWPIAMGFFHEYSAPFLFVMIVFGLQGTKSLVERRAVGPAA